MEILFCISYCIWKFATNQNFIGRISFCTFEYFDTEFVICDKNREKANEVKTVQVIGNVEGKDVIIIDDLIDTGGTISKASQVIMEKGANSVRALISHPVLSGNAEENLEDSALNELVVTDSIPLKFRNKKIKVLSIAGLIAKAIRKIHENESTSSLFINR